MTGEKAGGDSGGFESMGPCRPNTSTVSAKKASKALDAFVKAGGKLVTFGRAGELPIEKFGLPVVNVLKGKPSKEFWSPRSTLKVKVDTSSPLAFGMPEDALAIFTAGNQI